ncbi:MAG: hypothetical protein Q9210_004215 [Variospora velana]
MSSGNEPAYVWPWNIGSAYSWLLQFKDQETEERFQEGLMQALWEQLNEVKWTKTTDDDRQYVLDAFQNLTMEDAENLEKEDVEAELDDSQRTEEYDSDESADDVVVTKPEDGDINSQLAVGYKHEQVRLCLLVPVTQCLVGHLITLSALHKSRWHGI